MFGYCWHKWTTWKRVTVPGIMGSEKDSQERSCTKCLVVQRKSLEWI